MVSVRWVLARPTSLHFDRGPIPASSRGRQSVDGPDRRDGPRTRAGRTVPRRRTRAGCTGCKGQDMAIDKEWIPVYQLAVASTVGTVAGVSPQIFMAWRDRRAKSLEIEHQRPNQRNDFQRKTLLRLQVALRRYAVAVGDAVHQIVVAYRETGALRPHVKGDADTALMDTFGRVNILIKRVLDEPDCVSR